MDFLKLWNAYPQTRIEEGCASYMDQCAIRLSRALNDSGAASEFRKYGDPTCLANGYIHARGAESLANFLWRIFRRPAILPRETAWKQVQGKKGIIFFRNIDGYRQGRGDHIDLWNGMEARSGAYFGVCAEVWFWELS